MNIILKLNSLDGKTSCHRLPSVGAVTSELQHYSSSPFSRLSPYPYLHIRIKSIPPDILHLLCSWFRLQLKENHLYVVLHALISGLTDTERQEKACFGNYDRTSAYAEVKHHDSVFFGQVILKASSDKLDA